MQYEESDAKQIWGKTPNSDLEKIQELGSKGWELVSSTPVVSTAPHHNGYGGTTRQILFVFKRPKE